MSFKKPSPRFISIYFPILVFVVTLGVYLVTPRSSQVYSDSRWTIHLALSVIREGNLDLDEYKPIMTPDDYAVFTYQGHKYSLYPIGTPLLAIPLVFIYNLIDPNTFEMIARIHPVAQTIIASVIVAVTSVLIYLIAKLSLNIKQSLFVAFIFSFCTSAWSTTSRALWQHGPSMLFLALALYLLVLSRNKPWIIQFASIPLAYSYVIRPSNALSIIFISFYIFIYHRKYFIRYVLWSLIIAVPFFLVNYLTFHTLLPDYYHSYGKFFFPTIERLIGPLISPARGLFIYTPVFLFVILGIVLKLRNFRYNYPVNMLDVTILGIIIAHCLLVSIWWMWWGGYAIGPRMLTDIFPYLMYFLIPVVPLLTSTSAVKVPVRVGFIATLVFSFIMQLHGVTTDEVFAWNNIPTSIDTHQDRLWDWNDPPFLRGLGWMGKFFPIKVGIDPSEIHSRLRSRNG